MFRSWHHCRALKGALQARCSVCVCVRACICASVPYGSTLHLGNLLLLSPSGDQMVSIATGTRKFSKKCFVFETPGSERESVCVSVSALQANYVYDRISFLYEFTGIMILVHFSFSRGRICRWCAVAFNSCVLHVWCSDSLFILDFFLHHLLPSCACTQIWLGFRLIDMTLLFCMCLARGGRAQRQDVS